MRTWLYQKADRIDGTMLAWAHTQESDPVKCGRDLEAQLRGRPDGARGVLLNEFGGGTTPMDRHFFGAPPKTPGGADHRAMSRDEVRECCANGYAALAVRRQAWYMHAMLAAYRDAGGMPLDFWCSNVETRADRWNPHFTKAQVHWPELREMAGLPTTMADKAATIAMGDRAGVALAAALRMSAVEVYRRVFADVAADPVFVNIGSFSAASPVLDANGWPMNTTLPEKFGAAMFYQPGATPDAGLRSDLRALNAMHFDTVPVLGDVSLDGTRGREWWPAWGAFAQAAVRRRPGHLVVWMNRPPFGSGPDAEAEAFMGGALRAAEIGHAANEGY